MSDIKKEYQELAKKYKLPSFEEIDKEFEIKAIDLEKVTLINAIVRVIRDAISQYINLVETVVSPNPSWLHSMVEANNLSDKDKDEMLDFYFEVMVYYHDGFKVLLEDDKKKAGYIINITSINPQLRKKASIFLEKIKIAWQQAIKEGKLKGKKQGFLG